MAAGALLLTGVGVDNGVRPCAGVGVWQLGAVVQASCDALAGKIKAWDDLLLHIAAISHGVQPWINDELAMCQCRAWVLVHTMCKRHSAVCIGLQ